jgi:hypothetical protein
MGCACNEEGCVYNERGCACNISLSLLVIGVIFNIISVVTLLRCFGHAKIACDQISLYNNRPSQSLYTVQVATPILLTNK